MKRFLQSLSRKTDIEADPLLYIIVAQYQRAGFDKGSEHEFHWAIAVIENLDQTKEEESPCYQAVNKIVAKPVPHVEWSLLIHPNAVLRKTNKYRGGVIVGRVRRSELQDLDDILSNHSPVATYDGWNCRSWVMEGIELMTAKGWIPIEISSQERLLPTLRVVHEVSLEALARGDPPVVYELDRGV